MYILFSFNSGCRLHRSDDYHDELSWGGAWLYRATNDAKYLADAEKYYVTGPAWGQSWDEKNTGNMVMYILCISLQCQSRLTFVC